MGSVDRRGGSWRARWRSPEGSSRSKRFARKIDAQRFLASMEHSKQTGAYVDPSAGRIPFKDYAEDWREAQPHRHGTEVAVEQHLRLHVYPSIGARPMAAIRSSEIQGLVSRLGDDLSPSTVAVVYGRVVAVFKAAVRDRIVASSPCIGIRLPSATPTSAVTEVLTTAQVSALAEAVPGQYRAVILAGAGLGLRPGELFGLAVDRVEFLKRRVRVDQQLVRVRGSGVALGPLKTPSSYRTVPLPAGVATATATHMELYPPHPGLGLVFTNERGAPIQQSPFSAMFTNARRRAGLPDWATPHDLRHFYASTLIRSGASVKAIRSGSATPRPRPLWTCMATSSPRRRTAPAKPSRRPSPIRLNPDATAPRICVPGAPVSKSCPNLAPEPRTGRLAGLFPRCRSRA